MALDERRPTLLSVNQNQNRYAQTTRKSTNLGNTTVLSSLSVSGVTSSASQDVFSSTIDFVLVDAGMLELYAAFSGTIGAGNTMTLFLVMDSITYQVMQWTGSVTNQTRYSWPSDLVGSTTTRGGFQVRLHNLSAGLRQMNFRFTASGGTGSASSGVIAFRVI
jgi:hypothetical protein